MSKTLLDPKNDFVFKKLFVNAPDLLADLINAVRSDEDPVEVLDILNPQIEPEELTGKFILLDVLARDSRGRLFNIEMQVRRLAACRLFESLKRAWGSQDRPWRHYRSRALHCGWERRDSAPRIYQEEPVNTIV